jgi:hypothetical protein
MLPVQKMMMMMMTRILRALVDMTAYLAAVPRASGTAQVRRRIIKFQSVSLGTVYSFLEVVPTPSCLHSWVRFAFDDIGPSSERSGLAIYRYRSMISRNLERVGSDVSGHGHLWWCAFIYIYIYIDR